MEERVGLCKSCLLLRIVTSGKGCTFYLCLLSERDARFPKYPRLPVLACEGYKAREQATDIPEEPG